MDEQFSRVKCIRGDNKWSRGGKVRMMRRRNVAEEATKSHKWQTLLAASA